MKNESITLALAAGEMPPHSDSSLTAASEGIAATPRPDIGSAGPDVRFHRYRPVKSQENYENEARLSAKIGHFLVTFHRYFWTVSKHSPYTLSSPVIAAVAISYLLFVLVLLALLTP